MINVFNYPIEATTMAEFQRSASSTRRSSCPSETIFREENKKPQLRYRPDGRREIDGQIVQEDNASANSLWTTTISRGVAHEWRERAERGDETALRRRFRLAINQIGEMRNQLSSQLAPLAPGGANTVYLFVLNTILFLYYLHILKFF